MPASQFGSSSDEVSKRQSGPPAVERTEVILTPSNALRWLFGIMLTLLVANLVVQAARYVFDLGPVFGLWRVFDLNQEANIPTFFSGLLLLLAASLLFVIGRKCVTDDRPFATHWFIFALLFAFLSVDEMSMLHELVGQAITTLTGEGDVPTGHRWTIAYLLLTIAFGIWALRFYLHLSRTYQLLFALAGVLFIGGAAGMEIVAGYMILAGQETMTLTYALTYTIEETLEMSGVIVFIYALSHWLADERARVMLGFRK